MTCTVHMLVYNMVHIFLHGAMSGFLHLCAVLAHVVSCTSSGFFGWFPLLGFRHFSLTYQHNVKGIWEGQSKIVLLFFPICPRLNLKLFLALWWWMEAFCWTKMHVGRSWVWLLSGDPFQFFTLSACHQFVWILHDKMGQKSWKTFCHILFFM